jgi:hypothetical protein
MAKKNNTEVAAESTHTHFGFEPDENGKIVGPGTNPSEVKFEGDAAGPCFVHAKNGQPFESLQTNTTPAEGWYVRFGGTKEACETFICR